MKKTQDKLYGFLWEGCLAKSVEQQHEVKTEAHRKYWFDLRDISLEAADTLGVMHTLYVGLEYHATEVKVSAPNREEALEMMLGIINRVLDDDNISYGSVHKDSEN